MHTAAARPRRFRAALSFPGEHRVRVEQIAEALASRVGRSSVLYDKWYQAEFARPNLDIYLPKLYRDESDLLVFFLCAPHNDKEWCGLEWRVGRDLLKKTRDDRLMFLRLDDADIPGLYSIDGYLPIREMHYSEVADAIFERLEMLSASEAGKEQDAGACPRETIITPASSKMSGDAATGTGYGLNDSAAKPERNLAPGSQSKPSPNIFEVAQDGTGRFSTIAEAIGVAQEGDTILIGPGNYSENLVIHRTLFLTGAGGREHTVVESDSPFWPTIAVIAGHPTLTNLTVRAFGKRSALEVRASAINLCNVHITASGKDWNGGAIDVDGAGAEVLAQDCQVEGLGAGIRAYRARVRLECCAVTALGGVAVDMQYGANAALFVCRLKGKDRGVDFGGEYLQLHQCEFVGNGQAVAVRHGAFAQIFRCHFRQNDGGIYFWDKASGSMEECDFTSQRAPLKVREIGKIFRSNNVGLVGPAYVNNTLDSQKYYAERGPKTTAIIVSVDGSGDFRTISDALKFAVNGQYIRVRSATYTEDLLINKSIKIVADSAIGSCVVDGALKMAGHAVATLQGLVLERSIGATGAVVEVEFGQLIVIDCIVRSDRVEGVRTVGGRTWLAACELKGVRSVNVYSSEAVLLDCRLHSQEEGVLVQKNGRVMMRGSFTNGTRTGVSLFSGCHALIEDSEILGSARCGVIASEGSFSVTMRRSKIKFNGSYGIWASGDGFVEVSNCDVAENDPGAWRFQNPLGGPFSMVRWLTLGGGPVFMPVRPGELSVNGADNQSDWRDSTSIIYCRRCGAEGPVDRSTCGECGRKRNLKGSL